MIVDLDYEISGHGSFVVEISADVELEIDNNYGADADGNRGIRVVEILVNDYDVFYEGEEISDKLPDFIHEDIVMFIESSDKVIEMFRE